MREWVEASIPAVAIVIILFFVFWPFSIEGSSMEPTLFEGNRIAISRILTGFVKNGDIVVCKYNWEGEKGNMIKRVIGVPGDTIQIKDGDVILNGVKIEEGYTECLYTDGEIEMELASGEYFVLGDSRDSSCDSREMGAINRRNLVGKVILKWYPSVSLY